VDYCERCGGPATNGGRKPIVRVGITGLRTVRNPVAVVPAGTEPTPDVQPDVLCYVYDNCKAGCSTSRLHIKSRLVLVGMLPRIENLIVSEPFVIMARDKPRKTPRTVGPPIDFTASGPPKRKTSSSSSSAAAAAAADDSVDDDGEYVDTEAAAEDMPPRR
jgi:hypothetical protein